MTKYLFPKIRTYPVKILSSGCIEWTMGKSSFGYGNLRVGGKVRRVHRVMMGDPKGFCVLHMCDNTSCVNPEHLKIGSQTDNIQDMVSKGRQRSKVTHGLYIGCKPGTPAFREAHNKARALKKNS